MAYTVTMFETELCLKHLFHFQSYIFNLKEVSIFVTGEKHKVPVPTLS